MEEGWAAIAAAMQLDGWLQFSGIQINSKKFIAAEVEKILHGKTPQ